MAPDAQGAVGRRRVIAHPVLLGMRSAGVPVAPPGATIGAGPCLDHRGRAQQRGDRIQRGAHAELRATNHSRHQK